MPERCNCCEETDPNGTGQPAQYRVTVTDLEGMVIASAAFCATCVDEAIGYLLPPKQYRMPVSD